MPRPMDSELPTGAWTTLRVAHITHEALATTERTFSLFREGKAKSIAMPRAWRCWGLCCVRQFLDLYVRVPVLKHGTQFKPRQNIVYVSGERSRPCWTNVTHRIDTCWLSRFEGPLLCPM